MIDWFWVSGWVCERVVKRRWIDWLIDFKTRQHPAGRVARSTTLLAAVALVLTRTVLLYSTYILQWLFRSKLMILTNYSKITLLHWLSSRVCQPSCSILLPFRAFCVEGPQNLMFVRPCVCLSVCVSVCHASRSGSVRFPISANLM